MKKLFVFCAASAFALFASAQSNPAIQPQDAGSAQPVTQVSATGTEPHRMEQSGRADQASKEYVEINNGKLYHFKDGKRNEVKTSSIKLGEVKVNNDGTATLDDGSKINLNEGDRVTADGRVIRSTEKARMNDPEKDDRY
jgi:hypothetical protein